jgi:hypothetical protein
VNGYTEFVLLRIRSITQGSESLSFKMGGKFLDHPSKYKLLQYACNPCCSNYSANIDNTPFSVRLKCFSEVLLILVAFKRVKKTTS